MFSGQGSQYYQMGRALFDGNNVFRRWMLEMDRMVLAQTSRSVLCTLYDPARGKAQPFDQLSSSHPAIFMVEYALARTLIESGVKPDMVLGASLGTFAAAAVAGAISMEDALSMVLEQAAFIESAAPAGGMIAVLGDPALHEQAGLEAQCDIAAYSFPLHFVVSATCEPLALVEAVLSERGIVHQRVPVAYAFHSRWFDPAKETCLWIFSNMAARAPAIPLVCCAQAAPLAVPNAQSWWDVLRRPIDFQQTVRRLETQGPFTYLDVGPSGTLATFLKYLLPADARQRVHAILGPMGRDADALATAIHALR
jgi:bacillaene synthase trans-acting acyltransferase